MSSRAHMSVYTCLDICVRFHCRMSMQVDRVGQRNRIMLCSSLCVSDCCFFLSDSSLNVGRLISAVTSEGFARADGEAALSEAERSSRCWPDTIDLKRTYTHLDELVHLPQDGGAARGPQGAAFQKQRTAVYQDVRDERKEQGQGNLRQQFAVLSFEKPIIVSDRTRPSLR